MTELELHKYINENNIEWHKQDNEGSEDVIIFPTYVELHGFNKMLSPCSFDDGGIQCIIKDGYVAIWMNDICDYHGVEIKNIFLGENWES